MVEFVFVVCEDMFPIYSFPTLEQAAAGEGWAVSDLEEVYASEHDYWFRMWTMPGGGRIFQVQLIND